MEKAGVQEFGRFVQEVKGVRLGRVVFSYETGVYDLDLVGVAVMGLDSDRT